MDKKSWFKSIFGNPFAREFILGESEPEPVVEPEPEPVVEPEVGEYWVDKPDDKGPFYKEKGVTHYLILEVKSGWVRFVSCAEHNCEMSSFLGVHIKSDTVPVSPKPGEIWDLKSKWEENNVKEDPFPPDDTPPKEPIYSRVLAVKSGWVQFQWVDNHKYVSEKTNRDRIVSFTNSYYNTGLQFSTPEVDKSEEVV